MDSRSILHAADRWIEERPDTVAFRYLRTGDIGGGTDELTFADLGAHAGAVTERLRAAGLAGSRVLLLYPPGLDFVAGFLGTLGAPAVAVPAPIPGPHELDRAVRRLRAIAADAGVRAVLTTRFVADALAAATSAVPELAAVPWVCTDELDPGEWAAPTAGPDDLAFIQYTSGSTSAPKGVLVGHGNLMAQEEALAREGGHDQAFIASLPGVLHVSWLPMFHDMGLIAPLLGTVYSGAECVLMSPLHFLEDPARWLRAIDHFGAWVSGGPNFAYEITARRSAGLAGDVDLSRWQVAFNGSEPLRAATLEKFARVFEPSGFRPEIVSPLYGLAESTLAITGNRNTEPPRVAEVAGAPRVSCGRPLHGYDVRIVDPETHCEVTGSTEGEVWVRGPSVCRGYLGHPPGDTFGARLRTGSGEEFLRTGDLGAFVDGELYVTGRRKDLVIIDGVNHHPQDLELAVESAHPAVRGGCVIVFAVDSGEGEQAVAVAEVRAGAISAEVRAAVTARVARDCGVALADVALIPPRTIPKTSSGKLQRRACRDDYLAGRLSVPEPPPAPESLPILEPAVPQPGPLDVAAVVRRSLASALGVDPDSIVDDRPFAEFGLGSRQLVELAVRVGTGLERVVPASLVFEYPTVAALAGALGGASDVESAPGAVPHRATPGERDAAEPIAVIGMACRLPGADTPEQLWDLVESGGTAIRDVPPGRWRVDDPYDPDRAAPGRAYTVAGGFLGDVYGFDAALFGIGPREAAAMDPQHRVFLQTAYEALERSGIDPSSLAGSDVGVYLGMYGDGYGADLAPDQLDGHVGTGSAGSVAAGRLSYLLGVTGPALTVDTACSSSLVATHLAMSALRSGECSAAIVGGVSLLLDARTHIEFSKLGALSPSGGCHPFGAAADGTVWGEGCAVVVVKPLAAAQADGDRVLAVLRGSAVNQDGRSQGLSAPNGRAQEAVIGAALRAAGVRPGDIGYVETHGTATPLGDPIEARALARVHAGRERPLVLGALKATIGHTGAAAGVAGLIEAVQALRSGVRPGTPDSEHPTREIDWAEAPLALSRAPWPDGVRRAGVSAFGVSGTNAHVVLEQAPAAELEQAPHTAVPAGPDPVADVLPLSAATEDSLRRRARDLIGAEAPVAQMLRTLGPRRAHHRFRAAVIGSDVGGGLSALASGVASPHLVTGEPVPAGRLAFVCAGQGGQWAGMGRDLLGSNAFRAELERCDAALAPLTGWSVVERLRTSADVTREDVLQPLLFSVMVSLAALWRERGVVPDAVVGHSQGEVAAAYLCGALDLAAAARIVVHRSRGWSSLVGLGAMTVVGLGAERVEAMLPEGVSVAVANSGRAVVVTGDVSGVEQLEERLDADGVFHRRLAAGTAGHSPAVEPLRERLIEQFSGVAGSAPTAAWYSTVTGGRKTDAPDAEHWFANMRRRVRFDEAVGALVAEGYTRFVELSAHPTLRTAVETVAQDAGRRVAAVGSLTRESDGPGALDRALGQLYVSGADLRWDVLAPGSDWADLPTYPFDERRLMVETRSGTPEDMGARPTGHPLLPTATALPEASAVAFTGRVSTGRRPWLVDHSIGATVLAPGALLLDAALCAADGRGITELALETPLPLSAAGIDVQATVTGDRVTVHSHGDGDWVRHAEGTLGAPADPVPGEVVDRPVDALDGDELYRRLAAAGYVYGPAFRGVRSAWRDGADAIADVVLSPEVDDDDAGYLVHPALLDAALHPAALLGLPRPEGTVLVPVAFAGAAVHLTGAADVQVRLRRLSDGAISVEIRTRTGALVASIARVTLAAVDLSALSTARTDDLYELQWAVASTPDAGRLPDRVLRIGGAGPDETAELVARTAADVSGWLEHESGVIAVVTRGAVAVSGGDDVVDPAAAAVLGLMRSVQAEYPGRVHLVDIDGDADDESADAAASSAMALGATELVSRLGVLYVPRVTRAAAGIGTPASDWRLEARPGGGLSDATLRLAPDDPRSLRSGEVRVRLSAAGVNFHDVVTAMGMVPDDPAALGGEGAGVVIEAAADVDSIALGDRVFGLLPATAGTVAVDHRALCRIPAGWSDAQAAAVPVAFLTAYLALRDVAGLAPGETVVVHAATGGVGWAASELGRHWGADVYVTASRQKWDVLRRRGFENGSIEDSRVPAPDAPDADVVVGSLAGASVESSLRRLDARRGRYVELGKTDVRDPRVVSADHPGVAYQAIELPSMPIGRVAPILHEVAELLEQGAITAPPVAAWDLRRAPDAYRAMARARHIGKNVLVVPRAPDPNGTVLISGGTGLVGLAVTRHLAERGARNLLLLSRTGETKASRDLATELAGRARVDVVACDVGDPDALAAVLDGLERPLTAVYHAAGVLDDATAPEIDEEQVRAVCAPKVTGGWNLHRLTADHDIAEFVLFSSAANLLGSPGQGAYAAANAALEALAQHRRHLGLPGLAVGWGLWAGASGMGSGLDAASRDRLARMPVRPMRTDVAVRLLDAARAIGAPYVLAARLDTSLLAEHLPAFSGFAVARRRAAEASSGVEARLAGLSAQARVRVVHETVRRVAAETLGHAGASAIDPDASFRDLGFDSLGGVELRNRLQRELGVTLPATIAFDTPTPAALAQYVAEQLGDVAGIDSMEVETPVAEHDPIAIVGVGCRYPGGVTSLDDLWDVVAGERDVIGPFPTDRGWDLEALYSEDPAVPGTTYTRRGGFLDAPGDFDPTVFRISPREATAMDPQQRLMLEISWEALETAGIAPDSLRGTDAGVFTGVTYADYATRVAHDVPPEAEPFLAESSTFSVVSGRVAYTLGLTGPALSVDTACSSSLVAVHSAVGALRRGECSLALAGGVTVMATPGAIVSFARQRGLAPDGHCKPFADDADGTSFGEGAGVLVLERLSDARRLGHPVRAVIAGSAVNQDGASNGMTAPSGAAQQRVVAAALADAGLAADDVDVGEAHGTGTTLGDPIEATALIQAYGGGRAAPLRIGTLKSNIGHTQAASGVGGILKTVAAMEHGLMPRTLHAGSPSRHVDWSSGAVEVLDRALPWRSGGRPRRAGVSSFGISGTNAHVILEAAEIAETAGRAASPGGAGAWILSAATWDSLRAQAARLAERLPPEADADIGWSLARGRATLGHRAVLEGDSAALRAGLAALAVGTTHPALRTGRARDGGAGPVFVFGGHGTQWAGMAERLLSESDVFADAVDECSAALEPHLGCSVAAALRGDPAGPPVGRPDVVQGAILAVAAGQVALWEAAGVVPAAVIGHSQGEIAAAYAAGRLTLDDAASLVAKRAEALAPFAGTGGMTSVGMAADRLARTLDERWPGRLAVGAVNSPSSTTVTGDADALEELEEWCADEGLRARRVDIGFPAHSPRIALYRSEFEAKLDVPVAPGGLPVYSTVTGGLLGPAPRDHWARNAVDPVRFDDAVRAAITDGYTDFVEIGGRPVLAGALDELAAEFVTATAGRARPGLDGIRHAAAGLWLRGTRIDWAALHPGGHRVDLPTYAFDRRRYWLHARVGPAVFVTPPGVDALRHPILNQYVPQPESRTLVLGALPAPAGSWLGDHRIGGRVILPGAVTMECAAVAARKSGLEIGELVLTAPFEIGEGTTPVQVQIGPGVVAVHACGTEWVKVAEGRTEAARPRREAALDWPPAGDEIDCAGVYGNLAAGGFEYGPAYRALKRAWRNGDTLSVEVALPPEEVARARAHLLHPVLLDAAAHALAMAEPGRMGMPFAWNGIRLYRPGATALRVRLTRIGPDTLAVAADDLDGNPVLDIDALTMRPLPGRTSRSGAVEAALLSLRWHETHTTTVAHAATVLDVPRGGDAVAAVTAFAPRLARACSGPGDVLVCVPAAPSTDGSPRLDAAGAAITGLVRAAAWEYPGRIRLLHTDAEPDAGAAPDLAEAAVFDGTVRTPRLAVAPGSAGALPVLADGTTVVTGAGSPIAAVVARHLVREYGSRRVLLLGRRGEAAPGTAETLTELAELGADAAARACDVTDEAAVRAALAGEHIVAVVHAAGVVDDALLPDVGGQQVSDVLRPKIDGAAVLDRVTAADPPTLFAVFSSLAGVTGAPGQGVYAAANSALDAFARERAAAGRPTVSVQWGAWGTGMAERAPGNAAARMRAAGLVPLDADVAMTLFDAAVGRAADGDPAVAAARWNPDALPPHPMLAWLRADSVAADGVPVTTSGGPRTEDELVELVRDHVARVAGSAPSAVDDDTLLPEYGFDSLMTVELRNTLRAETGVDLPVSEVFAEPTVAGLARLIGASAAVEQERSTGGGEIPASGDVVRLLRAGRGLPPATHALALAVAAPAGTTLDGVRVALATVAGRHPILRAGLPTGADGTVRVALSGEPPAADATRMPDVDVASLEAAARDLLAEPFDIDRGPLWRLRLVSGADGACAVVLGAHHAVSDVPSLITVGGEIHAVLTGTELGDAGEAASRDLAALRAPAIPVAARGGFDDVERLALPVAGERRYGEGLVIVDIPAPAVVDARARELGVTPAAVYFAAAIAHLGRVSGTTRFAVAVPVDTRLHRGAEGAVGFHSVPVPVAVRHDCAEPADDAVRRAARSLRDLFDGRGVVGDLPVLAKRLHRAGQPLLQAYFSHLTVPGSSAAQARPVPSGAVDLDVMYTVVADPAVDSARVFLTYSTDVFDDRGAHDFAAGYLDALRATVTPVMRAVVAGAFSLGDLPGLCRIAWAAGGPAHRVDQVPHTDLDATLLNPRLRDERPEAVVLLVRGSDAPDTDGFATGVADLARTSAVLVVVPPSPPGSPAGCDARLADAVRALPGVGVLDRLTDDDVHDGATERLAGLPYTRRFQATLALAIARALRSALAPRPKVIAVDGDGTLWDGVAGEIGPDGVGFGPGRVALAERLRQWRDAGTHLVLVSNNDSDTVEAVLSRTESPLGPGDFAVVDAGWGPKAERLAAAAASLGAAMDAVVFLDDDPVQIARVAEALPEVRAVRLPQEGIEAFVAGLWPLRPAAATDEDRRRAGYRRADERRALAQATQGFEEFLSGLGLEVDIAPLTASDRDRAEQIVARTTQFVLGRARPADVARWVADGEVYVVTARDRFGDHGRAGLLALRRDGDVLVVRAWHMSCRTLGRGAEEQVLAWVADRADEMRCTAVRFALEPTDRNEPARRFVAALTGAEPPDDSVTSPERLRTFRSWRTE
ncbi:type I polyketide synthase [Tsukamurella sp. 8J]|uniref:type I polyketide synthase n=1 Tax=Tsukamurella sp. 8J TaxID=3031962 RepID=UPI0023B97647|nr:type I polyketide synthase [Tsukamurella sp. 8J]MDF0530799.1 SDR family NAD(P)-dependent oxidoreductase [Tsukamurella sp. 8J]